MFDNACETGGTVWRSEIRGCIPSLRHLELCLRLSCDSRGRGCRYSTNHSAAQDDSNLMCAAKSSVRLGSIWTNDFPKLPQRSMFCIHPLRRENHDLWSSGVYMYMF